MALRGRGAYVAEQSDAGKIRYIGGDLKADSMVVSGSHFPFYCLLRGGLRVLSGGVELERGEGLLALISNSKSRVDNVATCIQSHFTVTRKMARELTEYDTPEEAMDYFVSAVDTWALRYLDRMRAAISNEFRYFDIAETELLAFIAITRVRLLNVFMAVCTGEDASEISIISMLPTPTDDFGYYYRKAYHLTIPSTGLDAIGPHIEVMLCGRKYNAYPDYHSKGGYPDYIVFGEYPGDCGARINRKEYVGYVHVDHHWSRSFIPHFRLSCVSGCITIKGHEFALPTIAAPPIEYLLKKHRLLLDALVWPPSVLLYIPYGDGVCALIDTIINGGALPSRDGASIMHWIKCHSATIPMVGTQLVETHHLR